jgi:hypothetical protein
MQGLIDEEATVDRISAQLDRLLENARTPVDRRALLLLRFLSQWKAATQQNGGGPHADAALAAMKAAFERPLADGEGAPPRDVPRAARRARRVAAARGAAARARDARARRSVRERGAARPRAPARAGAVGRGREGGGDPDPKGRGSRRAARPAAAGCPTARTRR